MKRGELHLTVAGHAITTADWITVRGRACRVLRIEGNVVIVRPLTRWDRFCNRVRRVWPFRFRGFWGRVWDR